MPVKLRGRVFTNPERVVDPTRLVDNVGEAMGDVVSYGADRMVEMIETRGTGKVWAADWSNWPNGTAGRDGSYPGRVASGQMRSDVSENVAIDGNRISGSFGWLSGTQTYYLAQELGFRHHITGGYVDGMHALRDSARETDEMFYSEIQNAVKRYLAGK